MVDRSRLPAVGAESLFTLPEVRKSYLPNGLCIWTLEHRAVPLLTCAALLTVGSAEDPPDRPGLASLTGDMLDEGAGDRTALGIHEELARIGATFDTEVGPDATLVTITMLARFRDRGIGLLADLLRRPRFEPEEFDRVRSLRANRLRQLRDLPSAVAERAFATLLYGDHPYGHLAIGTEGALAQATLDEVTAFHARAFRPPSVTIVAAGDASHDDLVRSVEAAFGDWNGAASPKAEPPDGRPAPRARLAIIDRPGAAQSELRVGHVAAPRHSPDHPALLLVNLVLGGQFVSRINMQLRERKGVTYGARSSFDFRRAPGPFAIQTSVQTSATAESIADLHAEVEGIREDRPITAEELDVARAALTRGYPRNFETAEQIARALSQLALYDLPDDYFERFVPTVRALAPGDVQAAAARHLRPADLVTLVVGDRAEVGASLEALSLGVPVALAQD